MAYQSELEKLKRRYEEKPTQWFAALAEEHRRAGDVELALQIIREGLENRSNYVSGHIVLARCLLDRGEDAEAQQELERVLELDGENVIALKVLSEIAERLGDPVGARGWVDRLLEVDPMNQEGRLMKGRLGDVGAATSEPSSERPSRGDLVEPEAPPSEPESPEAAEEETPPSPAEPEAAEEETPPSPTEPAEASAEITGAEVEHDAPLELSPEAGEGPPPEDLIGVQVERPEPIELVGGPGMVVGQDQAGELVGRAEEETGEEAAPAPEEEVPSTVRRSTSRPTTTRCVPPRNGGDSRAVVTATLSRNNGLSRTPYSRNSSSRSSCNRNTTGGAFAYPTTRSLPRHSSLLHRK